MHNHSFETLEYNKLKMEIAKYSHLINTEERLLALSPLNDIYKAKKEITIVIELSELMRFDGGIEINNIKDIEFLMKKVNLIGTYLEAEELFYVCENLKIFRRVKSKILSLKDKYKNLNSEFEGISSYKELENIIDKIVDNEKKIKDDASLELSKIRNEKNMINYYIKKKFDEIIANPSYEKMIQEKIVTIRDGRYVIPIKAEFKGQLKGVEHDRSSSGQTIYIEPFIIVQHNNKLREYEVKEREEIRKILLRMTDILRSNIDGLKEVDNAIKRIDFLNSKSLYANATKSVIPKFTEKEYINLVEARHPFIDQDKIVPLSFGIGKDKNILLITGPNTGGKTVALKTAGLLTLMALSGIPIPANEKTEIGFFTKIYADIGDEQSIEQNLSSFSGHLKNIKNILENINRGSLILLDELGSGTDPIEGAAFAMAIIDYIKEKKAKAIITTHYSEVKAYGYNEEDIESASMEFDISTLSPTYRLMLGIPGESNALTIAKKLGISEEVIERARNYISEEDKKVEKMILNIKEKSDEVTKEKYELENLRQELENLKKDYNQKIFEIENEKQEIIKKAYDESLEMVKNASLKAKSLINKLQKEDAKKEDAKETERSLNMLMRSINEDKKEKIKMDNRAKIDIKLDVGQKILVKNLNQEAIVLRVNEKKNEVQVQAGILKLSVPFEEIKIVEKNEKNSNYVNKHVANKRVVKYDIDIRGLNLDEGIVELEHYLDSATLNSYTEVHIIHGKGTGKLRLGIQEYLRTSSYIREYRDGNYNEGGLGVTVATLK
ncbi:MAG: endonuclease MutS2 [Fusobacteria bacterium]|nr:endonuclease MutS2 [Fusobacteriota bacterium]